MSSFGKSGLALKAHWDTFLLEGNQDVFYVLYSHYHDYMIYLGKRKDPNALNNRAVCYYRLGEYDRSWADVDSCRAMGFTPHPLFLQMLEQATGRKQ